MAESLGPEQQVTTLPRRLSEEQRERVTGALSLVVRMASHLSARHGFDHEESVSVGKLALTEAVFHYDPSTGVPFQVFAFLRVRGEILDTLAQARKHSKRPIPTSMLGPLASDLDERSDPLRDSDDDVRLKLRETLSSLATSFALSLGQLANHPSAEDAAIEIEQRANLKRVLAEARAELPEVERAIIDAHYEEGVPLSQLPARMQASYRTVRRKHQNALTRLASTLRDRGVKAP